MKKLLILLLVSMFFISNALAQAPEEQAEQAEQPQLTKEQEAAILAKLQALHGKYETNYAVLKGVVTAGGTVFEIYVSNGTYCLGTPMGVQCDFSRTQNKLAGN